MTSLFNRLWQFIRKPTRYVGRDLEGNKFYEYPSRTEDPRRTRRVVKYVNKEILNVGRGGFKIPVQWTAWLAHTRPHPPTLEELQRDRFRLEKLMINVKTIQEREQAEREAGLLIPETNPQIQEADQESTAQSTPATSPLSK
ncbi:hypothetical protein SISSUDRAFT_1049081, partial [Sistotremastrum suecicum HHB10207 ss-3]